MYNREDITVVSFKEFNGLDFKHPNKYFIEDALGNYVFPKTRTRKKAQEIVNDMYGSGKYTLRTTAL